MKVYKDHGITGAKARLCSISSIMYRASSRVAAVALQTRVTAEDVGEGHGPAYGSKNGIGRSEVCKVGLKPIVIQ